MSAPAEAAAPSNLRSVRADVASTSAPMPCASVFSKDLDPENGGVAFWLASKTTKKGVPTPKDRPF